MEIATNIDNINEELILIKNLFGDKLKKIDNSKIYVDTSKLGDNKIVVKVYNGDKLVMLYDNTYTLDTNENVSKYIKMYAKIALYKYFSKVSHYRCPWGALTGIRPTKLYYELLKKNGGNKATANYILSKTYKVSSSKIQMVNMIAKMQEGITYNPNSIDLYINIPFCTSKCYYCSFISSPIAKCQHQISPYIDALKLEITKTLQYLKSKKMTINTIYVGGGTPTSIGVYNLKNILEILPKTTKEFTVEAGRPDSITKEMLDMLASMNVTRISINPQTFNNETLHAIGRNHSAEDVYRAYRLARQYNFEINMDLIAGLANESFRDFKHSLNATLDLEPDNITIHTLSVKRSSTLATDGGDKSSVAEVERMVKYSSHKLLQYRYNPYYMYRQKNMLGNLENIGYANDRKICEFNINSMEETLSVIACGANAISKRIFYDTNKIERHANVKNIDEYINRLDEMITKKFDLFDK